MGDTSDDQTFDISQVTSAGDTMKVEPPATAGLGCRKDYGRGVSAKPRGRVRKATSDTGAKQRLTSKERAAAEAFVATAATSATPQRSGDGGCVKSETAEEVPLETVTTPSAPPSSTTTTTSLTAMMASQPTALVEAVVDSFQQPWQSLSGESFVQLEQEEQQQQEVQHSLQEPPPQQQEPLDTLLEVEEALLQPMPQEQARRLGNILSGYGLQSADDECFEFVNVSRGLWNDLVRRQRRVSSSVVSSSAESRPSGERPRIVALLVAPPSTPLPTHVDDSALLFSDEADRPFTGSEE